MAREDVLARPSVLAGLVGSGIQASRTPRLHEREGAEQGLHYMYRLIDLEVLGIDGAAVPEILTAAQRFGFAGLNITHPCKQIVLAYLDELSAERPSFRTTVFTARRTAASADSSSR
jgi:shikimate dehydrogenase